MKKIFEGFALLIFCFNMNFVFADYPDQAFTEFLIVDGKKIKLADGTDFSGTDLRGVEIHRLLKQLKKVNFSRADLSNADFRETEFVECNFSKANLTNVLFDSSVLKCDFTDAVITGTGIYGLNKEMFLLTQNAKQKDLSRTGLANGDFSNIDFSGFNFRNSWFYDSNFKGCNFSNAIIEGISLTCHPVSVIMAIDKGYIDINQLLQTKDFQIGLIKGVKFHRVHWPDNVVDLSHMVFIDCEFGFPSFLRFAYGSTERIDPIAKIKLIDSVISGCDFQNFPGLTLENVKSTWNYKHNRMEGIKLPEEIQKALDAEKKK